MPKHYRSKKPTHGLTFFSIPRVKNSRNTHIFFLDKKQRRSMNKQCSSLQYLAVLEASALQQDCRKKPGHTQNMVETSNGPISPKCPKTTSNLCRGLLHIQEKMSRWKQMSAPKTTGLHDFLADFEVKTCYVNSFSSLISYHFIKYHLKLGYCLKQILLEDLIWNPS